MRSISITFIQITALLLLGFSRPCLAAKSPSKVITEGAENIRKVLKKKAKKGTTEATAQREHLKKTVEKILDYRELAKRSLGPHWKARTDKERDEFITLLRDLIESSYTGSIRNNVNFNLEIEDEQIDENNGTSEVYAVASAKNSKGKTVSEDLTFHLFLKKQKWFIYDVEFGDVSLVRHYRGEFNRKIKKESYAALVKVMKKKLKEIKSGKVEKKLSL